MRLLVLSAAAVAGAAMPLGAHAGHGLNLVGYGVESVAMAGADTAVARDTSALNTNPAGLAQLRRPAFDGYATTAIALDVGHADALGNDQGVRNDVIPVAGFGFSRPLAGGRLTAGLGFFGQGGAGAVYKGLRTPFGTEDELSALVGVVRVSPGIAWQLSETFAVGIAVPLTALFAKQRVFPATSVVDPSDPSRSFFGLRVDDSRAVRFGMRLGAMWKPSPQWTIGATFSPKKRLDAKGGEAEVNMSAAGLGVVSYREARLEGFALAREMAVGVAWQATPSTLLALKLAHLDWSDAMRSVTLTLTEPINPAAPAVLSQIADVGWRDQLVVALGLAHRLSDRFTAYAGFNYGRDPTSRATLTPLLAPIADRHVTGGLAWRLSEAWTASGAVEYQPQRRVRYENSASPLGIGAEERSRYVALHFMGGRRW